MKLKTMLYILISGALLVICLAAFNRKRSPAFEVVKEFSLDKYLGTWHEIARLDFKFERNLSKVTATYSLREDGKVKVDNRGYDTLSGKWKQSVGKAKFTGAKNEGGLLVSFFGPFYSQYNIVALDKDYQYALVLGESTRYMWILSREKTIPAHIRQQYLDKARSLGVATEQLVWVKQED